MKEFNEFRFNRLEERAWRLTHELEARGKTEAEDTDAKEKPDDTADAQETVAQQCQKNEQGEE